VASVVGQSELLVALFAIPAVTVYINGRNGAGLTPLRQAAICLLFILACFSKEHGVTVPVLLLAAELIVVDDKESIRKRFVKLRPFVLALTAVGLGYLAVHQRVSMGTSMGFHPFVAFTTNNVGTNGRIWTMFGFVPDWVRLFLWPARLTAEYGPPEFPVVREFAAYQVPGMLIVFATLTLIVVAARRKSRAVAFGLAFCCIALLPTSNFIVAAGLLLAERTLFMPSVGAMIAVGAVVPWIYRRVRIHLLRIPIPRRAPVIINLGFLNSPLRIAIAAGFVVVVALGIWRSHNRSKVWVDNDTLFAASVADAPNVYRSHYILGAWHFQKKRKILGEKSLLKAIELYDRDPYVFLGLGQEYLNFYMYRSSVPYFRRVLEIDSTMVDARSALTLALTMLGEYDEAEMHAHRSLREHTRSGEAVRWSLDVIKRYRATGEPPPIAAPPPRVSPTDTASASSKVPPIVQITAPDSVRPPVAK
jgi:hypothetical protein